jgi:hypothetical protein
MRLSADYIKKRRKGRPDPAESERRPSLPRLLPTANSSATGILLTSQYDGDYTPNSCLPSRVSMEARMIWPKLTSPSSLGQLEAFPGFRRASPGHQRPFVRATARVAALSNRAHEVHRAIEGGLV